jgi:LPS-assembly protein
LSYPAFLVLLRRHITPLFALSLLGLPAHAREVTPLDKPHSKTEPESIILEAQTVSGQPDLETVAQGDAELQRGGIVLRSDRITYQQPQDRATAAGNVYVTREGNVYTGSELQLQVQKFEGFLMNPTYFFNQLGAGGTAKQINFLGDKRAEAISATYTSCPNDESSGKPAWVLSSERVRMDFVNNEGLADGAVLRFYGVPILGAPHLSFPLTDARKSGWLPPNLDLDSKSGFQFSIPYYWNMAPQRDATFTPQLSARRGAGLGAEFRYLEPNYQGEARVTSLPWDRLAQSSRYAWSSVHSHNFVHALRVELRVQRVSDNNYWKDFPRDTSSITPRLLASDLDVSQPLAQAWDLYARARRWQVLQTADLSTRIEAPYERLPQIGARFFAPWRGGFEVNFEGEINRFTNPADAVSMPRPTGLRVHALAGISLPYRSPGWSLTPRLWFNAASYSLDQALADGRTQAARFIPAFSLDSQWELERELQFFNRNVRQTLEPRLLYVNNAYRDQSNLPNFDASAKDFNFDSIYSENSFSGIDRVADAHQLTAGVITRVLEAQNGSELLRLGLAQRYLFSDQRITANPSPTNPFMGLGPPLTQRFSDVLLLGSTTLLPKWVLDASLQYSPDSQRLARSVVGVRYSPAAYKTVSLAHRLTRGLSEQVELGWQWPIYGPARSPERTALRRGGCTGRWYSVGRLNYSTLESRLIDSVLGVEYDAGCWIGRVVATRLSTGRSEATTRLSVQLELLGLSRLNLGTNPLQVLKDNVPGFRALRDASLESPPPSTYD